MRVTERLRAEGLDPEIVSGGGTGTHDIDHELGVFTEIQAGTYVLMDTNYYHVVQRRDEPSPFGPALFVRTTVISNTQPGFVITDAGIKEVDGMSLTPRLSLDLDYNYSGSGERETMKAERAAVEATLADVFIDHGLRVKKRPSLARDHGWSRSHLHRIARCSTVQRRRATSALGRPLRR
ncbi:MAG: hypothetical protein F4X74_04435 [Acidimicrobiia bacterium]|nr:hypothetical protein [Acidimicrobiia bacterium]